MTSGIAYIRGFIVSLPAPPPPLPHPRMRFVVVVVAAAAAGGGISLMQRRNPHLFQSNC